MSPRRRRALSPLFYADTGRLGYSLASRLEDDEWQTEVFRKLADQFHRYVISLNWVHEYTTDPFYQWMLREFEIT